jgi:hypothetical protein
MIQIIESIIWLAALIFGIWFMVEKKKNITAEQPSLDPLSGKEKLLVFVLCLVNPIVLGAIFYYGWKKKLPQQAKTANYLSFAAFVIFLCVYFGQGYLFVKKVGVKNIQNIASNLNLSQDLNKEAKVIAERTDAADTADIQAIKDKIVTGYAKAEQWQSDAKFYGFRRMYTVSAGDPEQFLKDTDSYFYESKNTSDNCEVLFDRKSNNIFRVDINPNRLTAYVNQFADTFTIKVGPNKALEIAMLSPTFQKFKDGHKEYETNVILNEPSMRAYGSKYYQYWMVSLLESPKGGAVTLNKDNSVLAMVNIVTGDFISPEALNTLLQIQDASNKAK